MTDIDALTLVQIVDKFHVWVTPNGRISTLSQFLWTFYFYLCKGSCHLRFSGFCPLGGTPPPIPLTENQCEKKKVFFLNGIGGYPPPLTENQCEKEGFFP